MDARDKALKTQVDGMVAPAAALKTLVEQIDARDKALKAQVDGMVAPAAALKILVEQIDARDKALKTQVDAMVAPQTALTARFVFLGHFFRILISRDPGVGFH